MKKNVAIIVQKLTGGGAERVAANLSISLSKKYNVFLYVFNTDNITYEYQGHLTSIDKKRGKNKIQKILNIFRRIRIIKKLKKNDKINVAISFLNFANYVNVMSRGNEKTIISIRNNIDADQLLKIERYCIKKEVKKADKVVSLSKAVEKQLNDLFNEPQKTIVIYNSIPPIAHKDTQQRKIEGKYIVTMGRLMKQKGQWHIIKAFSIVHEKCPDLKLVILGEGELYDSLLELTYNMGLSDSIIFYGYSNAPHEIIRDAQLFIFPSVYEGLGNSVVEALSVGKCIISTNCNYGPQELLSDGNDIIKVNDYTLCKYGILIPAVKPDPNWENEIDTEEIVMAESILRVINDNDLREKYEKMALLRAKDFSENIIVNQWINLIENL